MPTRHGLDVVACGGGTAGAIAAIAAGRSGARTLPFDQYGTVGGMTSTGMSSSVSAMRVVGGHSAGSAPSCSSAWWTGIETRPVPGVVTINATRVHGIDGTDADEFSRAEVEIQRQMFEVFRFPRHRVPGFAHASGTLAGVAWRRPGALRDVAVREVQDSLKRQGAILFYEDAPMTPMSTASAWR